MTDLDPRAAHQFWYNYEDPSIYRVIAFMESVETWTLDGNEDLEKAMKVLGESLEGITKFELTKEDQFVQAFCFLKMSRVLRLMQAIDTACPGSASRLLMFAENNTKSPEDLPGLFLRRNVVFERLRLLFRIFSPERFMIISKALGKE